MAKKRANNEGTIYQLPSGSWRAQIFINGHRLVLQRNVADFSRFRTGKLTPNAAYRSGFYPYFQDQVV